MAVDTFYQLNHRRLRETFKMETIERHEARIMAALAARREAKYRNETKHDRVRFSVQEKFADGWHSLKLFAQRENAEHFATMLKGDIRIMPLAA